MDFKWVEGVTTIKNVVRSIAIDLVETSPDDWELAYPQKIDDISDIAIISAVTSFNLRVYVKLEKPEGVLNYMLVTLGRKMNETLDDIDTERSSEPARFAWYKETKEIELFEWASIQYWMSFSRDFVNIIVQGDPSLDIAPYNNYLISYAYFGSLDGFEGADKDSQHNFGLTVSSDVFPKEENMSEKFGKRTATCITDIGMLGTRTGTPFQAHLPKFSTVWEYADKNFITSSQWTHKYHMSDIIVFHAYDRERGKLKNVLIGDRSAIFHLDMLVIDKDTPQEKQYVMFNINAPYSILNNGANVLYGIAIRRR